MPHEVQTTEPTTLVAGTTWAWDRTLSDHPPSDGWTLKYALRGPTDLDTTATADGETYEIRVSAVDTANVTAGTYRLYGYVEQDGERHVVYDETLVVTASPLAAVNDKSHAETMLEELEAKIAARVSADEADWTQGERSARREELRELNRMRGIYASIVWRERNPGKSAPSREVRFGAAR